MSVTIENPQNLPLQLHEQRVLRVMFADYHRLVVKSRLAGGLSGSCVYLVRPIQVNGPELPAVVKIDLYERIEQEWEAFSSCIQRKLPSVADIHGKPVNPPGSQHSGLWYPLAGDGIDEIVSLQEYLLNSSTEEIAPFLEKQLFKRFGTLWKQAKIHPDFQFRAAYDEFLPLNLKVHRTEAGESPLWLHPETIEEKQWLVGDFVQVSGFKVVKLLREKQGLSLDTSEPHRAFRLHVYGVDNISEYEIGQVIQRPFTGSIQGTRQRQLLQQAQSIVEPGMDLQATVLPLSDGRMLPNPLSNWGEVLRRSLDVKIACIHGDLNMENVLVNRDLNTVHLIDFARSRRDHVLRDLLHLEMTVVNKFLSGEIGEGDTAASLINDLYQRLHCAVVHNTPVSPPSGQEKVFAILHSIRHAAGQLLFQSGDWREYYYGLFLYLLGSLRFGDLDRLTVAPRPKQLAFWGAATILDLLENEPMCKAVEDEKRFLLHEAELESPSTNFQSKQNNKPVPSQLHLDTAIPQQIFVETVSNITVVVRWSNFPKLREYMIREGLSMNESYVWHENESSEEVEVFFVASNCEIIGPKRYTFWLNQEHPSQILHFQIIPKKVGRPDLIFSLYQQNKWIGSAFAKTSSEEELVGGVQTDILTFLIEKTISTNEQRIKLLQALDSKLNKEELINLCFELEIDYENLSGENKKAKVRELITYCERRGQTKELLQASHNHIPIGSIWSTLSRQY